MSAALQLARSDLDALRVVAGGDAGVGDRDDPREIVAHEVLGLPVAQQSGAEKGEDHVAGDDDRAAAPFGAAVDDDRVVMREDRFRPLHSGSLPDSMRIGKRETRHAQP